MNWKKILLLALVLAALGAVIFLVERGGTGEKEGEGTLLDLAAEAVDRIELRNAEGEFAFVRRDAQWRMEKPLAVKADKAALEGILDNFSRLRYDRLVAEGDADLKTFGLDRPAVELRLLGGGKPLAAVLLGIRNSMDESSYAMLANGARVVAVAGYKRDGLDKGVFAFRDKKFLAVDPAAVTALEFRRDGAAVALAKKDGDWVLEKPVYSLASGAQVNDLLSAASLLEATSFAPAAGAAERSAFGLDKPLLTAEFRQGPQALKLAIGKSGDAYFAQAGDSDEVCGIAADFAGKFDADPATWRETRVARFFAYDVRGLRFAKGDLRFTLRRNGEGEWAFQPTLAGKKPDRGKVEALLNALTGLEATGFLDQPRPLPATAARLTIETEDTADPQKRQKHILEIAPGANGAALARDPALPYGFTVPGDILEKLPARIEDLLASQAAPENAEAKK